MGINDKNRGRKTYSFFRAAPVAANPTVTIVSGANGIIVTGDKTQIIISSDSTSSSVAWSTVLAAGNLTVGNNPTLSTADKLLGQIGSGAGQDRKSVV